MRLRDTLRYRNIDAAVAGTQATHADSRSSDEWIKDYLDKKNKRLNDLREELHNLLDFPEPVDIDSAYREDKKFPEQKPGRVGGFGPWCVVTPEGEILSRWPTKIEARNAAWGMYRGLKSSTGPTAGAQVRRLDAGGEGSGCRGDNCGRPRVSVENTFVGPKDSFGTKTYKLSEKASALANDNRWVWENVLLTAADGHRMGSYSESDNAAKASAAGKINSLLKEYGLQGKAFPVSYGVAVVSSEGLKDKGLKEFLKVMGTNEITDNQERLVGKWLDFPASGTEAYIKKKNEFIEAADIFQDPDIQDKTRSKFKVLQHPKPRIVRDADTIRMGDNRPSSNGQGAAGTGGAGAGGAGGGVGI